MACEDEIVTRQCWEHATDGLRMYYIYLALATFYCESVEFQEALEIILAEMNDILSDLEATVATLTQSVDDLEAAVDANTTAIGLNTTAVADLEAAVDVNTQAANDLIALIETIVP